MVIFARRSSKPPPLRSPKTEWTVEVSALAERLGVTDGAPFRHFESRQALLVAVAEEGTRRLVDRMNAAATGIEDPLESERARGVAYVRFAVEEPGYFRTLTRAEVVAASPRLQECVRGFGEAARRVLGRTKRKGAQPPNRVS